MNLVYFYQKIFTNIKELFLSHEEVQKELAKKSNRILEEIIDIEPDILEDSPSFEVNLGFAKVSRSVKKVKK